MKLSRLLLAVATLAFLFTLAVSTAIAGTTGNGWTQRAEIDLRYLITSVDATTGTIQVEFMRDKTTVTYKIDANTKIRVGDNMGTIDQIKVGMQVRNYFLKAGQTPGGEGQILGAIVVNQADPAPVQPPPPTNK
jgi:hypothetical protein